jgi:predicted DNA-binding transcriptional regulator AlpA
MAIELRQVAEGEEPATIKLLTIVDVLQLVPVSKGTIKNWERKGIFPRAQKVGGGITSKRLWLEADVNRWIAERGAKWPMQ